MMTGIVEREAQPEVVAEHRDGVAGVAVMAGVVPRGPWPFGAVVIDAWFWTLRRVIRVHRRLILDPVENIPPGYTRVPEMPHSGGRRLMAKQAPGISALGARVHLFVRPQAQDAFVALFRDVLGCDVRELDFGLEYPILFVPFEDGSGFSVEFSERAPAEPTNRPLDDDAAFRGAWLEFRTADLDRLQAALRAAGIPEFRHPGSSHVYFSAPGGQVFRLLDVGYVGP